MGSTFLSLHYHIIFSTKHRAPVIAREWRSRLHEYMGGTVRGLGGVPQAIAGIDDHVHLLVCLRATHTLADFIRELKKAATAWVHDQIGLQEFMWQEGYAAFTVSPTAREGVTKYILNQEDHHLRKPLIEELNWLLQEAEIEFGPRYLE